MGERKNVFQKYRLCLVLSVMAVVLVAFSLLFLKEREEQPIEETPETKEVSEIYKVEYTEPGTETEEIPKHEEKPEPVPEPVTEYPAEQEPAKQEPVPEPVPEQESIPQEEEESETSTEEEHESPASQEQEEPCRHSWVFESFYQKPTCSNGGLENQVCVHCGETQITGGTPTGEHVYRVETPGDCCSEEVVVCTECNYREIKEKNKANHIDVEDGVCYGCGETIR